MKSIKINYSIVLLVIIAIYLFSLTPSFTTPFYTDDVDLLSTFVEAKESHTIARWFFAPHNEHIMPVLKAFYFLNYEFFGMNPLLFHWLIALMCVFMMVLIYKLLFIHTDSKLASILGVSIWAGASLLDFSMFRISNSHMAFNIVCYLFLFYSMSRYFMVNGNRWIYGIIVGLILAPLMFSTGVLTLFFCPLYWWLCIQKKDEQKTKVFFISLVVIWLLTAIPYFMNLMSFLYLPHYVDMGRESALQDIDFLQGLKNIYAYYFQILPLNIFPLPEVFALLTAATAITVVFYRERIHLKMILFLMIFSLTSVILVAILRSHIVNSFVCPRYFGFTLVSVCMIIALVIGPDFEKSIRKNSSYVSWLVCLFCILLVIPGSMVRHRRAELYSEKTTSLVNGFYSDYRDIITKFFDKYPEIKEVQIKDFQVISPAYPGPINLSRYSLYLISQENRAKIKWTDRTDDVFAKYIHAEFGRGKDSSVNTIF